MHSIYILAYSGFAAVECYRASPYDVIYIIKIIRKLRQSKVFPVFWRNLMPNSIFFAYNLSLAKGRPIKKNVQIDPSVPEEIGFKHTNIGT